MGLNMTTYAANTHLLNLCVYVAVHVSKYFYLEVHLLLPNVYARTQLLCRMPLYVL